MKYSKILVPVEFTKTNKLAINRAIEIQELTGADLTLAHVIDYAPPPYLRPQLPEIFASDEIMKERAGQHLEDLVVEMDIERCERIVRLGNAKDKLLELIKQNGYDLVVMAKHNRAGIATIVGSTTNAIVNKAPCEVLVMHE